MDTPTPTTPEKIRARLDAGETANQIARDLQITSRHVRRLAHAAGWVPGPRTWAGPRTLRVPVSAEVYAGLARHGEPLEVVADLLYAYVAEGAPDVI